MDHPTGHPLDGGRITVGEIDVAETLKVSQKDFGVGILDADNGPDGVTHPENDRLYEKRGLQTTCQALNIEGGRHTIWLAARA